MIKEKITHEWQNRWDKNKNEVTGTAYPNVSHKNQIKENLNDNVEDKIFKMKINHVIYSKLGCRHCGKNKINAKHDLITCPQYENERTQLKRTLMNKNKPFNIKTIIEEEDTIKESIKTFFQKSAKNLQV